MSMKSILFWVVLVVVVVGLGYGIGHLRGERVYTINSADTLTLREDQLAVERLAAKINAIVPDYNAAQTKLNADQELALKHAGADPKTQQVVEVGGKLVVQAIPATPAKK